MCATLTIGVAGSLDQAANVLEVFCSSSYNGSPKPVTVLCSKNSRLESARWRVKQLRADNSTAICYFILRVKATKPGEQAAFRRCHQYLGSPSAQVLA